LTTLATRAWLEKLEKGCVLSLAWNTTGTKLATGSRDGCVHCLDFVSGASEAHFHCCGSVWSVGWHAEDTQVTTSAVDRSRCEDRRIRTFEVASGDEVWTYGLGGEKWCVSWSPDGSKLATGDDDGVLHIVDISTKPKSARMFHHGDVYVQSVAWIPDSITLATGASDGLARVFNSEGYDFEAAPRLAHGDNFCSIDWSPDGIWIATGSYDHYARIFNTLTRVEERRFKHGDSVDSVAWSPDGSKLATGCRDWFARVFDFATGAQEMRIQHPSGV